MKYALLHLLYLMSLLNDLLENNYFAGLSFVCCLLFTLVEMSIDHSFLAVKKVLFLLLQALLVAIICLLEDVLAYFLWAIFKIQFCLFSKLN
jgi:hypothetical protein